MRLVFHEHGLVVEPAGVAGLAAAITFRERFQSGSVVTPLCGGNLTEEQIREWLSD
jgi:threonine dehydratase